MSTTKTNNPGWQIEHFSSNEEAREELVAAIMLLAEDLAEERPNFVGGLLASIGRPGLVPDIKKPEEIANSRRWNSL